MSTQKPKVFRVQFVIDGDTYSVFPVRGVHPEVATRAYRFKKNAGEGAPPASTYDVMLDTNGLALCECKGYLRWGHCRHIKTLVAFGCFPAQPAPAKSARSTRKQPAEQEPQPAA